ncbi:lipo-like protein [Hydrogenophaga sp.]|uniref:lipo-like protein n=1 Tax=Hydrogenophaga sp. TaxID=1904254 RepID=UPI003F724B5E
MNRLLVALGTHIANYLWAPKQQGSLVAIVDPELLVQTLRPGDVQLVEGNTRVSVAIKYLTQSTWSHAALFVGDALPPLEQDTGGRTFIEADLRGGVRSVGLSAYAGMHTRICRPVGLSEQAVQRLIDHAVGCIGHQYDLRNVLDLARYLAPIPPVPARWRRRLLALGSGDPSRAICSTLIAQAFQSLRYPILPDITRETSIDLSGHNCRRDILDIGHHSLYTPRDFDISPYFEVVKPSLRPGFDYRTLPWADGDLRPPV